MRGAALLLAAGAAVGLFSAAVDQLDSDRGAEQLRQVEEAVRRGCAACYASEGVYPPTLDYLRERYGLQIDGEGYVVYYSVIGQNLMPSITVAPVL